MKYYNPFYEEIKDDRIEILSKTTIQDTMYILAKLHPKTVNYCSCCKSDEVIKFGVVRRKIKLQIFTHYKTDFSLELSRLKCKNCGHIFYDRTLLLGEGDRISNTTKMSILNDLKQDLTFTYVANKNGVSIQTTIDIFENFVHPERRKLPEVICMDEFKNLKSSNGKFAFLILDPQDMKIVDVVEDRRLETLENYFYNIGWKECKVVKYVVTDMYEGYRTIIKRFFPNATHVVDAFHYLRYVEDAFNNVRIRIQNKFNKNTPQYRILKKYWKILSTYIYDVEDTLLYNHLRKRKTSSSDIITDSLLLSAELSEAYDLCQSFLKGVREVKFENSLDFLTTWSEQLKQSNLKEFNELAGLFKNWKVEISNSFIRFGDKRLNNGPIEGMNNHVKVIKRISYGYRNFKHFRARLMYIINEDVPLHLVNKKK